MKNIAIIPARAGSKGLRDKNIKKLCGKPLIAYTIEAAIKSKKYDTIYVSTESEEYANIAREYGAEVPFLRRDELATDEASTMDVIKATLLTYKKNGRMFDTFTILQPTSPLRNQSHIAEAFKLLDKKNAKGIISVCEVDHSPLWSNTLPESLSLENFISMEGNKRRQEIETYYRFNGAIYISKVEQFLKTGNIILEEECYAYIMAREYSIDIDTNLDFLIAETIMNNIYT